MSHLDPVVLARCADGLAEESEARHLETCEACRAEVAAIRAQTAALGALPPRPAPPHLWARIARELDPPLPLAPRRPAWRTWLPRAAAGLALFLGGGLAGTMLDADRAPDPEPVIPAAEATGARYAAAADSAGELERVVELEALIRSALYEREALITRAADEEAEAWF